MPRSVNLLLILLASFVLITHAKLSKGHIKTKKHWKFVEKFCFDESVFYADMESQWPSVFKYPDRECITKVGLASKNVSLYGRTAPMSFSVKGARPRWWYLTFANCDPDQEIDITYRIHLTNQNSGRFSKEFSKDEQGVWETSIAFTVVLGVIGVMQGICFYICKRKKYHSKIVIGMLVSEWLEFFSALFICIHWSKFSNDGVGNTKVEDMSLFFDMFAIIVLLYVLLLLVKGWPISTNFVYGKRLMMLIMFTFTVAYLAIYVWNALAKDPASTLYMYDSTPGYIIIALRLCVFAWACRELYNTFHYENEAPKKAFYIMMAWYIALFFLSMPVVVLIAHFLNSWERKKIVVGLTMGIATLTYLLLLWIFRPTKGNRYFVLDPNAQVSFGSNKLQIFPM